MILTLVCNGLGVAIAKFDIDRDRCCWLGAIAFERLCLRRSQIRMYVVL
ncbi:MAG: hypothetical protein NTU99_05275 [Pseudanabaena sp. LacPavin_0818_WC45_MAG_42_6]|nr:hypothetical protein [Pseudanabaena sp. LacPavin_0818_WC45_MAG_42_6]